MSRALWLAVFDQALRDLCETAANSEAERSIFRDRTIVWLNSKDFDQVVSMIGVNEDIIPCLRERLLTAAALPLEDRRAAINPLLITTYTERTKAPRTRPKISAAARRQQRRLRRSRLAAAA